MEQTVFNKMELSYISDGLITLIKNAGEAVKLVHDVKAQQAVNAYVKDIQALNSKICDLMDGKL